MNRDTVRNSARMAGAVKRYHAWPTLQQQTVADHSWNVMRIWWQLWGAMKPHISTYILWHDLGELWTGDLPFPIKREYPALKKAVAPIELDAVRAMGMGRTLTFTAAEKTRLKICDLLEMWEYGCIEVMMGNKFGQPIVIDTMNWVRELAKKLSQKDQKAITTYITKSIEVG